MVLVVLLDGDVPSEAFFPSPLAQLHSGAPAPRIEHLIAIPRECSTLWVSFYPLHKLVMLQGMLSHQLSPLGKMVLRPHPVRTPFHSVPCCRRCRRRNQWSHKAPFGLTMADLHLSFLSYSWICPQSKMRSCVTDPLTRPSSDLHPEEGPFQTHEAIILVNSDGRDDSHINE